MSTTDDIIRVLRSRVEVWRKQEQETTAKLMEKLASPDSTYITTFDGERFLELKALRAQVNGLTNALARLDEPDTDPEEWLESITNYYRKHVRSHADDMMSSSSVAANRMDEYERVYFVRVLDQLEYTI